MANNLTALAFSFAAAFWVTPVRALQLKRACCACAAPAPTSSSNPPLFGTGNNVKKAPVVKTTDDAGRDSVVEFEDVSDHGEGTKKKGSIVVLESFEGDDAASTLVDSIDMTNDGATTDAEDDSKMRLSRDSMVSLESALTPSTAEVLDTAEKAALAKIDTLKRRFRGKKLLGDRRREKIARDAVRDIEKRVAEDQPQRRALLRALGTQVRPVFDEREQREKLGELQRRFVANRRDDAAETMNKTARMFLAKRRVAAERQRQRRAALLKKFEEDVGGSMTKPGDQRRSAGGQMNTITASTTRAPPKADLKQRVVTSLETGKTAGVTVSSDLLQRKPKSGGEESDS